MVVAPCLRVKLALVMVSGFISSLNVAATISLMETLVAPLAGIVKLTVGAVVSHGMPRPSVVRTTLLPVRSVRVNRWIASTSFDPMGSAVKFSRPTRSEVFVWTAVPLIAS